MFQFSAKRSGKPSSNRVRRGFTLAEVLVTLAIIAVMAAVLLPALNQQIAKGDTGRLASDLTNIQTAAQAFVSDVHRYPTTISQLTTAVTGNALNADGSTSSIPSALQAKWKGPYLSRDALSTTGGGGTIVTTFSALNSYLAVSVSTTSASTDWAALEAVLDEGTGNSSSTGNVRMSGTTNVVFLALPIQ